MAAWRSETYRRARHPLSPVEIAYIAFSLAALITSILRKIHPSVNHGFVLACESKWIHVTCGTTWSKCSVLYGSVAAMPVFSRSVAIPKRGHGTDFIAAKV